MDIQSIYLWFLVNGDNYFVCRRYGTDSQDSGYSVSCLATIPLIPGAALYRTMNWMMMQEWDKFCADGTYTILFAASMAAGMTLTTILFRMVWSWKYRQRWM